MIEADERQTAIRNMLTIEQRVANGTLSIDPGFVNHRKIETLLGEPGMQVVNHMIRDLPNMPDGSRRCASIISTQEFFLGFAKALAHNR